MIVSHMPFDYLWQFTNSPISHQEFIEGKNLVPANISGFEFPNYKYTLIARYVQPKIQPIITISGTTTRKEIELIGKHFKF